MKCTWSGCDKDVADRIPYCGLHWLNIPLPLRKDFLETKQRSMQRLVAKSAINIWISNHGVRDALG